MTALRVSDLTRLAATLAAALALSAICVGGAITPAGAAPRCAALLA
ncbi:MAG: hypothetical protein JOY99_17715 [Sphingomonadaceae bacterium]|nr:hypothetical protein [Sphingomonadaceae bacterium]